MKDNRPVFLNLAQIRLPAPGIASILHRASGVLLFLSIPASLWLLQTSLAGENSFAAMLDLLHQPFSMLLVFVLTWSLSHHLLAGIRYLLLDIDIGLEKKASVKSAWITLLVAPILAILLMLRIYL